MEDSTDCPLNSSEVAGCRGRSLTDENCCDTQEIKRLKAKLAVPARNRSRDLQKLELLQLRVEAAALQQKVKEMQRQRATQDFTLSNADLDRADELRRQAWRRLATKHKTLRREAELENESLRQLYSSQLEACHTLQKLIMKRTKGV